MRPRSRLAAPPLRITVEGSGLYQWNLRVGVKRGTWNGMERGMERQTAKKLKDT